MYCKYCGAQLPDSALFCNQCGKDTEAANAAPERETAPAAASPKKKTALWITAAAVITVLLGAAVLLITGQSKANAVTPEQTLLLEAKRLFTEGEYEEVILQYEALLTIDPKNVQAYVGMAEAYVAMGDVKKAQDAIAAGLETIDPQDQAALQELSTRIKAQQTPLPTASPVPMQQMDLMPPALPADAEAGDAISNAALDAVYQAFVKDTLIPTYGLADMRVIKNLYESEARETDDRCLGVVSAKQCDLDKDGRPELVTIVCVEHVNPAITIDNIEHHMELQVYAYQNGTVVRLQGCEGVTMRSVISDYGYHMTGELCEGESNYIFVQVMNGFGGHSDVIYRAYTVVNGALVEAMHGKTIHGGGGEKGLLLAEIPAWMEEDFQGHPIVLNDRADQMILAYSYNETEPIVEYAYEHLSGEYREVYSSVEEAVEALLRPVAHAKKTPLLDPVWNDHTGLRDWIQ